MADQNQSSSFDLKIPPPNLPTGNVPPSPARPPAPPPAPLKPSQPSPVGLSAFPPPAPKIVTGAVPPPAPSPNIKSSIRTMQDDLAALGKWKIPISPVPPPRPAFAPPPPPARIPTSLDTSGSVRANPDISGGAKTSRPSPGIGAQIAVRPTPKKSIFSRSGLLAILTVLIIGGFSLWFLVFYEPSPAVVESPTPSITVTPTPLVIPPLESAFTVFEKIIAPLTPSFFSELEKLVNKEPLVTGEPGLFKIISPALARYPFLDFALGTDVPAYPASVQEQIYDDSLYLTMLTKTDGKLSHGFILKTKDAIGLAAVLKDWEPTMTNDLKKLFSLNTARAAIAGFLDNTYQGAAIRYRNFPDPLNTIDYAVVDAPNGESYLVFANSKVHIYAVIDKIKSIDSGAVPGK